jgi:predicted kinase
MFNICPKCGLYSPERRVQAPGPVAVCPHCGYQHPFRQLPLFVLTGASGSGKSTLCLQLPAALPGCVVLDSDLLWRPEFDQPADNYRAYRELWLRLVKNISQSGRPVMLCGTVIPDQFEDCVERRYLATIHYLTLVCAPAVLRARLRERPAWRGSGTSETVERMAAFNQWLVDHAAQTRPPMALLDTTDQPICMSLDQVCAWVRGRLIDRPADTCERP